MTAACNGAVRGEESAPNDAGGRDAARLVSRDGGTSTRDAAPADDARQTFDATPADARPLTDANPLLDAAPPPCPSSRPPAGSACTINDFVCAYGTNQNPRCNWLVQCVDSAWEEVASPICPSDPGPCPSSYSAANATVCDATHSWQLCEYPEGSCTCGYAGEGSGPSQWTCSEPTNGCPALLPKLDSTCPLDAAPICNYGGCSAPATTCIDGFWSLYLTGCT